MDFDTRTRVWTSVKRVVLIVLVLTLAGCVSMSDVGDRQSNGPSECKLMHELVEPSGDFVDATETYTYENLSSEARHAFDEALANGSYSTTDQRLKSSEFRYWDTTTSYDITYQNETYKLLTYTGEGCE